MEPVNLQELKSINELFDFFVHHHYKCSKCSSAVFYSMGEVQSEFDVDYIDCPFCGQSQAIDIDEFLIKGRKQSLITKKKLLLAEDWVRVVHGGRGDYIELDREQILSNLENKFTKKSDQELLNGEHFYEWLYPSGDPDLKIYRQLKTVTYADYKIGKYYISVDEFPDFKDPEKLF